MSRPISTESVFRAIAHPSRRRILELVARREWPACDLASQFNHTQPTLSGHIRTLEAAGLLQHQRRGNSLLYRISPAALAQVQEWLSRVHGPALRTPREAAARRSS